MSAKKDRKINNHDGTTGFADLKADKGSRLLHHFAQGLDKSVNLLALLLFVLVLLYAGHSLWYNYSLKNDSFLSDELAKYKPDGRKPSLADLKKINPDVVSWISIKGTNINYPVVQGKDDDEYLNKTVLGEFSLGGSIFLSSSNHRDFRDPYNMLYGHHIDGGAMLSDVLEFRNASFFKKHPNGILWYPDKNGKSRADRIEFFSALLITDFDEVIYADPSTVTHGKLPGVVRYIQKKSTQKRKVTIEAKDRIIGLYTCENATSLERALLFGKLVPMTDEEIRAAEAEERKTDTGSGGFLAALGRMSPWLLPTIGIILLILIAYIIWRKYRQRRERSKAKAQATTEMKQG